jgi:hypothetical protein
MAHPAKRLSSLSLEKSHGLFQGKGRRLILAQEKKRSA